MLLNYRDCVNAVQYAPLFDLAYKVLAVYPPIFAISDVI